MRRATYIADGVSAGGSLRTNLTPQTGAQVIGGTAQGAVDNSTWIENNWWLLVGVAAVAGVTLFFVIRK
ncbi:MAG TPA: hypothetical protein VHI13_11775 [Candidatus Kapabacteria bacterium]|nr:hypothetical protein [Candidatus Kapabacteria bacterium]